MVSGSSMDQNAATGRYTGTQGEAKHRVLVRGTAIGLN